MKVNAMKSNSSSTSASLPRLLTTNEFAAGQRSAAQTVRKNLCNHGHHHGVTPIKHPNGRLLWRSSDLQALLKGHTHGK
jgi:hypothetical protein